MWVLFLSTSDSENGVKNRENMIKVIQKVYDHDEEALPAIVRIATTDADLTVRLEAIKSLGAIGTKANGVLEAKLDESLYRSFLVV